METLRMRGWCEIQQRKVRWAQERRERNGKRNNWGALGIGAEEELGEICEEGAGRKVGETTKQTQGLRAVWRET